MRRDTDSAVSKMPEDLSLYQEIDQVELREIVENDCFLYYREGITQFEYWLNEQLGCDDNGDPMHFLLHAKNGSCAELVPRQTDIFALTIATMGIGRWYWCPVCFPNLPLFVSRLK